MAGENFRIIERIQMSGEIPIDPEQLGEIHQFSKEHSQTERDETARQIKEKRGAYFERQKDLSPVIEQAEISVGEKEAYIQAVTSEVMELEDYSSHLEESILKRLTHILQRKKLKTQIGGKTTEIQDSQVELTELTETLDQLTKQRYNQTEMIEAEQILGEFWQSQSESWQDFEQDKKDRDVKNICLENNCFLVHSIHPTFIPGNNSLLEQGTTWQEKAKILLSLEPTLSASSVHEGDDGNHNLWAKMGVILGGGKLQSADMGDIGSKAIGVKERIVHNDSASSIKQRIQEAITQRGSHSYNEFVIQDPEVAGFFICLDESDNPYDDPKRTLAPTNEIIEFTQQYKIPLFSMKNGKVFPFNLQKDLTANREEDRESLEVKDVLRSRYDVNGQRDFLLEDIFEAGSLKKEKLASAEASNINSFIYGQEEFIKIHGIQIIESGDFDKYIIEQYKREFDQSGGGEEAHQIPDGTPVIFLGEINFGRTKKQYFVETGQKGVLRRYWDNEGRISTTYTNVPSYNRQHDTHGNISLGGGWMGGYVFEQKPMFNFEDYLTNMEQALETEIKEREEVLEKSGDLFYEGQTIGINDLCFHLYGFAEEAGKNEQEEVKSHAIEIANKYLSIEKYQEIIKRRLDEGGNFRLTREDVGVVV